MKNDRRVKLKSGLYAEQANYKPQLLEIYKGNPLIEALPPILSTEESFEQLSYHVPYNNEERLLPAHIRYHGLLNIMRFFQPVRQHLDLQERFSRFIRQGYLNRNPLGKQHVEVLWEFHKRLEDREEIGLPPDIRSSASSFTLMGYSGIGKTTAIERILSLYPQLIFHSSPLNVIQVVWLKLNCPHDGSLKTLCMDFFLKIDELLGTNYLEKFGNKKNSISSMVIRMGQISRLHCIGAIIIDEIQHLSANRQNDSNIMLNFFVTLVNEIGVPVMMIGTMKARKILQKEFRQARRGSGQGDMVWQQMHRNDDWDILIESLWDYQWTKNITVLTDEIKETIYEESQGITDIAVKLFALSQGRAIITGKEEITPSLIKKVAKEELQLVQPMIKALKSGLESEINKYEDIKPMDIKEYLLNNKPQLDLREKMRIHKERRSKESKKYQMGKKEKVWTALLNLGYEKNNKIENLIDLNLKKDSEIAVTDLLVTIINLLKELDDKGKKTVKVQNESNQYGKLIKIIKDGKKNKQSAYDVLFNEGLIKIPTNDF